MAKNSAAVAKVQELNRLAGYNRFSLINTPLPGKSSSLANSYSIHDTQTGINYAWGSIAGTVELLTLTNSLKKQQVDAVSGASPSKYSKKLRHSDFSETSDLEDIEHGKVNKDGRIETGFTNGKLNPDDEAALLTAAIKQAGFGKRLFVQAWTAMSGYTYFIILDRKTGNRFYTIDEALSYIRKTEGGQMGRSRERNVDKNATPVKVTADKTKSVANGDSWKAVGYNSNASTIQEGYEYMVGAGAANRKTKRETEKRQKKPKVKHSDVSEFIEGIISESENELEHYGVLGMKWGIHKDPQRAYERANKKLEKLDKKATKAGAKATRKEEASVRRQQKADSAILFRKMKARSADRSIGRSERSRQNYTRKVAKAVSWYKEMENAFRDTKIENLNQNYVALGEKYSKIQVNDLMANAQTNLANKQLRMIYRQMGK